MTDATTTWAVVGGGVLGMQLARLLATEGADVTVFESADDLGGLASAWEVGGVTWDRHYHVITPADRRTLALVEALGLSPQLVWRSVPAGCEGGGHVHPATTPRDVARLPFLSRTAKARLAVTVARAAAVRDSRTLEDVPVTEWLHRWSGAEATERFWLPLLRSKLGITVDIASASFIATTIRRLLLARLRGRLGGDGFGFVIGGYARVVRRLADDMTHRGVKTRTGQRVTSVRRDADGLAVTTSDGQRATYDRVVVTAAAPLAAALCPDLAEWEHERCGAVTYQGIVCLSVLLPRPLTPYYVTYLTGDHPFTAVVDMTALTGPGQMAGHGMVYLPRYVGQDDPRLVAPDGEVTASFLRGLCDVYPDFRLDEVVATRLSRTRHVLPVPTLGYSRQLPPVTTSVPGLFLVSSALITNGTLNVDETLAVAEAAVPQLLAAT